MKFQSSLPRGERQYKVETHKISEEFQSSLPRGERQAEITHTIDAEDFNPRSREGSDQWQASDHP